MSRYIEFYNTRFRKEIFSIPPKPDNKLILSLGCSFTSDELVEPRHTALNNKTSSGYPYALSLLLPSIFSVWNVGWCGGSTCLQLILAQYFSKIKPEIIIFQIMQRFRNPITEPHITTLNNIIRSTNTISIRESINHWRKLHNIIHADLPEKVIQGYGFETTHNNIKQNYNQLATNALYQDIILIKEIINVYKCPFIFLINNKGYPWVTEDERQFYINELIYKYANNSIVVTPDMDGLDFLLSDSFHPNPKRQVIEAIYLSKEIINKW